MGERPESGVRNSNYLSVAAAEYPRVSTSSIGSYATEVEDDSDLVSFDNKATDKHTKIRLSRLDCLVGVFFPGKAKRKVEKTMVTEIVDENEFMNNHKSPWIITVNVLSKEKAGSHFIPKTAQCTVDTGNLQGNTVSREFLLDTLRYPESAIEPLKDSEKYGGVSTTGDILMPEGACHLTWYHGKSTQVFRRMRFLISPNPRCDLVIGARSIERHNLLSPPNLMADVIAAGDPEDPNYVELNKIQERLNTECVNLESAIEKAITKKKDPNRIEALKKQQSHKEKELIVAQLDIDIYKARRAFAKDESPENGKAIKDIEGTLEDAKKDLNADDGKVTVLKDPKSTTTTGRSAGNGSAAQRHAK